MGRQYIAVFAVVAVATIVSGQYNVGPCFKENHNSPQSSYLGVEQFGMKLFRELASSTDKSIFISPYSIWSVFLLAYFGSGGRTQQQLAQALGVKGKTYTFQSFKDLQFLLANPIIEDGAVFTTLNKAYFDQSIPLKKCVTHFIHNIKKVNFRDSGNVAEKINQEISAATKGEITKVVEPGMLGETVFLLLNAVYFKGVWEIPFSNIETIPRDFKDAHGKIIGQVDMMVATRDKALIAQAPSLGAEILELPYANSSISMFLILPNADSSYDVDNVLRRLTPDNFQKSREKIVTSLRSIEVGVPKFKMETTLSTALKQAMARLGVLDLFTRKADLSSFTYYGPIKADRVVHKAIVKVSEEGTVAAAATVISIRPLSIPRTVVFDRPFIFLIHDKRTEITLFSGIFRHPDDATPL